MLCNHFPLLIFFYERNIKNFFLFFGLYYYYFYIVIIFYGLDYIKCLKFINWLDFPQQQVEENVIGKHRVIALLTISSLSFHCNIYQYCKALNKTAMFVEAEVQWFEKKSFNVTMIFSSFCLFVFLVVVLGVKYIHIFTIQYASDSIQINRYVDRKVEICSRRSSTIIEHKSVMKLFQKACESSMHANC